MQNVEHYLRKAGFKSLGTHHKNANGPDITITKNKSAFTVEVKNCRITKRGSLQVEPVEKNRQKDDFIAIVTPSGIIIFEPMKDHLLSCSPKGYRTLPGCLK